MSDPQRFVPPSADPNTPTLAQAKKKYQELIGKKNMTATEKWAVCVNMAMKSHLDGSTASDCIAVIVCFGQRQRAAATQFTPYLVAEQVRTSLRLLRCELDIGNNTRNVFIKLPLQFSTSHDVIAGLYDSVRTGASVEVFALGVQHFGEHGNICQACVGALEKLMTITKPGQAFLRRTSKTNSNTDTNKRHEQPDQPAKAASGQSEQQNETGVKHGDAGEAGEADEADMAEEGLELLLEEAEKAASEEVPLSAEHRHGAHEAHAKSAEAEADIADDEFELADSFCRAELGLGFGIDIEVSQDSQFAAEMMYDTDEHLAEKLEKKIVEDVKKKIKSSTKKELFVRSEDVDAALADDGSLTIEQAMHEAMLNDSVVCGNTPGVLTIPTATDSTDAPGQGCKGQGLGTVLSVSP